MSLLDPQQIHSAEAGKIGVSHPGPDGPSPKEEKSGRRGHSRWMMIACCIPMLALAIVLVATGVVGAGFIVVAIGCTLMMAMMMVGMSGDH